MSEHRTLPLPLHAASLLLLTIPIGLFGIIVTVWTVCTEPLLAQILWPEDIHQAVVEILGGDWDRSVIGSPRVNLSLFAIGIRLLPVFVLLAAVRVRRQRARREFDGQEQTREAGRRVWMTAFAAVCGPMMFCWFWLTLWFVSTLFSGPSLVSFVAGTTPLWIAGISAWSVCMSGEVQTHESLATSSHRVKGTSWFCGREWMVVAAGMILWECTSFWMNERLYTGLRVPHGDSAMYEEHLWNLRNGKGFRSYLDQGLFLGEHIQVIHVLLLPLHMIWPSYLMMELAASLSLMFCCVPLYSLTRRHTGSSAAAMWLSLAWLLYYPMHYLDIAIDLKTLRPSCYGLPFLFWGIDLAERGFLRRASVCLLVAMSTQEDFAMITGGTGLAFLVLSWSSSRLRGKSAPSHYETPADVSDGTASSVSARQNDGVLPEHCPPSLGKWGAGVMVFSLCYLLLAVLVVIPAFRDGDVVHYSRYFGDLGSSPGELIRTAVREPLKVLEVLFSFRTLGYLMVLTVPLGLMTWRKPVILLAAVPTFTMLSLIQLGNDSGGDSDSMSQLPPVPYHHFHAPLLPILLWSAAAGVACFRNNSRHDRKTKKDNPAAAKRDYGDARIQTVNSVSGRTLAAGDVAAGDADNSSMRPALPTRSATQKHRNTAAQRVTQLLRLCTPSGSAGRARLAFLCAAFTGLNGSMMPTGLNFWSTVSPYGWRSLYVPDERSRAIEKVLAGIPKNSRVASTDYVHTRLTHFERSYDYSDYLRAVNDYRPGVPPDTEYIIIDTAHPYSRVRNVAQVRELQEEPEQWELLPDVTNGLFIVLKRIRN